MEEATKNVAMADCNAQGECEDPGEGGRDKVLQLQ